MQSLRTEERHGKAKPCSPSLDTISLSTQPSPSTPEERPILSVWQKPRVCVLHSSCNASLIISKSTDSGTTWTAPNVFRPATCSNGSGAYHDKPSMKVDTSASPNGGKIYASWTRIDGCPIATDPLPATSVMVTRLTDTGSSFTQDVETRVGGASGGNTNTQVVWSDVALAPNGDVYVGWVQITRAPSPLSERITVAKSTDGGQTFTTLSFPANFAPFVVDALHPPSFEIDVDPSVPNLVYL